jgi:hypothetical protein
LTPSIEQRKTQTTVSLLIFTQYFSRMYRAHSILHPVALLTSGLRIFQSLYAIQRGDLVALGERRIVEYVGNQIVHSAIKVHHQLPDMDEFAGLLTDDVHAQ